MTHFWEVFDISMDVFTGVGGALVVLVIAIPQLLLF